MDSIGEFFSELTAVVLLIIIGAVILASPMEWLMNLVFSPSLLQSIFGVSSMTFLKMAGFNILAGLILASAQKLRDFVEL